MLSEYSFMQTADLLKISLVQTSLHWEDPASNIKMLDDKLRFTPGETDLIVLPEMFNTGFSMNPGNKAEHWPGASVEWMTNKAKECGAAICGSLMIKEGIDYFNRFVWIYPTGERITYDKRHLFSFAGEHEHYQRGRSRIIIEYKGWRLMPLICYDLRFPVWSRNDQNYDALIYVANWPSVRSYAWDHLLIARAIENQSYVIAVNRTGEDGNGTYYSGNSCVIDSKGDVCIKISDIEQVITTHVDKLNIKKVREKFRFLEDKDDFALSF